jgi:hypothetical protein
MLTRDVCRTAIFVAIDNVRRQPFNLVNFFLDATYDDACTERTARQASLGIYSRRGSHCQAIRPIENLRVNGDLSASVLDEDGD